MLPTEDYAYRTLDDSEDCIRLLKLLPACTNHADDLWGELITCRREDAPPYQPVSYTWGQQDASSTMFLRDGEGLNCRCFEEKTGSSSSPQTVFRSTAGPDIFSKFAPQPTELELTVEECAHAEWRRFAIRPNLETFLRRLRDTTGPKTFWVDAICINQKDNHEKAYQVRNMDKVYRGRHLIMWLGEPSENSDAALELIRDAGDCLESHRIGRRQYDSISATGEALANLMNSRCHMTTPWKAFFDLIKRPWFTRRWVVQEFVLSDDKYFYLGNDGLPFEYVVVLCTILQRRPMHLDEEGLSETICRETANQPHGFAHSFPAPVFDPVGNLNRLWAMHKAARNRESDALNLERLLDSFASFESYDPRDGIYAFLSMASDVRREEWTPDYSENNTVADLYKQAVTHIIRRTRSVDIICRRVHIRTDTHPSSWIPWFGPQQVEFGPGHFHSIHGYNTKSLTTFGLPLATLRVGHPDFTPKSCKTCGESHLGKICDGCNTDIKGTGYKCLDCLDFDYCYKCIRNSDVNHDPTHRFEIHNKGAYFASGRNWVNVEVKPSGRYDPNNGSTVKCLTLGGFLVDTVKGVGSASGASRKRQGMRTELSLGNWTNLPGMKEIGLDEDGRPRDVLLRALTGNRIVCDGRLCHMPSRHLESLRQPFGQAMAGLNTGVEMAGKGIGCCLEMMMSNSRRIATTERSLGFVPAGTVTGDRIALLVGCSVPVVVRQIGSDSLGNTVWCLIGECYIDGLMEGE